MIKFDIEIDDEVVLDQLLSEKSFEWVLNRMLHREYYHYGDLYCLTQDVIDFVEERTNAQ